MIYSEKGEDPSTVYVWTSNPANGEIYSYVLKGEEEEWIVSSKTRSYQRDHPRFNEKVELEPESTRAVRKHAREEYGLKLKS